MVRQVQANRSLDAFVASSLNAHAMRSFEDACLIICPEIESAFRVFGDVGAMASVHNDEEQAIAKNRLSKV